MNKQSAPAAPWRRVVVKVGTSTLTAGTGRLFPPRMVDLVRQIAVLRSRGAEVVLVTSGAQQAGRERLGSPREDKTIPFKQMLAAVGQGRLMHLWEQYFDLYDVVVAQVLLTREDVDDRKRYLNVRDTFESLIQRGIVPVVNENDAVATDEIKVGDNDNLSALVTNLANADLLIILSDIDGLYDRDPRIHKNARLIPVVPQVTEDMEKSASGTLSPISIGGMVTKLQAARKAALFGIPTILANGMTEGLLERILRADEVGTLFTSDINKLTSRKHWIAFTLEPRGKISVDEGAKRAILQKGKSLLPSGVLGAEGKFGPGDPVVLTDLSGRDFAKGLVNYASAEVNKIKGLKTSELEGRLGYKCSDEIVHRDDLVCFPSGSACSLEGFSIHSKLTSEKK